MQSSQIIVELLAKLATIQNAIQPILLASSKTASTNWPGWTNFLSNNYQQRQKY